MISLRKTLKLAPELSDIIPSEVVIRERITSIMAGIRESYFQLPMIYIQATIITVALLLALAVGLIAPWWGILLLVSLY